MIIITIVLVLMVAAALWASMTSLLMRSAIALALTSALLAVVMYGMGAVWAAVFELSVCAGLISVVFVTVISLTHTRPLSEQVARRKARLRRFWPLPLVLVVAGVALSFVHAPVSIAIPLPDGGGDFRTVMWNLRQVDLFGQILVILAGAFGVLVLFKGEKKDVN